MRRTLVKKKRKILIFIPTQLAVRRSGLNQLIEKIKEINKNQRNQHGGWSRVPDPV